MIDLLLGLLLLTAPAEASSPPPDDASHDPAIHATTPVGDDVETRLRRLETLLGLRVPAPVAEAPAGEDAAGEEIPGPLDEDALLRQELRQVRLELLRLDQRLDALETGTPGASPSGDRVGDRVEYELRRLEREVADLGSRLRTLEMRR